MEEIDSVKKPQVAQTNLESILGIETFEILDSKSTSELPSAEKLPKRSSNDLSQEAIQILCSLEYLGKVKTRVYMGLTAGSKTSSLDGLCRVLDNLGKDMSLDRISIARVMKGGFKIVASTWDDDDEKKAFIAQESAPLLTEAVSEASKLIKDIKKLRRGEISLFDQFFYRNQNLKKQGTALLVPTFDPSSEEISYVVSYQNHRNFSKSEINTLCDVSNIINLYLSSFESKIYDDLTGVFNYRFFRSELKRQIDRVRESSAKTQATMGNAFSLLMIDANKFKPVNDFLGHQNGGEVIVSVARGIEKAIRSYDCVFRYGGDEFVVLLHRTTPEISRAVGERIYESVKKSTYEVVVKKIDEKITDIQEKIKSINDELLREKLMSRAMGKLPSIRDHLISKYANVTVAIGSSTYGVDIEDVGIIKNGKPNFTHKNPQVIARKLIDYADKAMYKSKKLGEQVVLYSDKDDRKLKFPTVEEIKTFVERYTKPKVNELSVA